jgi:hypothetical protein
MNLNLGDGVPSPREVEARRRASRPPAPRRPTRRYACKGLHAAATVRITSAMSSCCFRRPRQPGPARPRDRTAQPQASDDLQTGHQERGKDTGPKARFAVLARGDDPPEPPAAPRAPRRYFAGTPAAHRGLRPGSRCWPGGTTPRNPPLRPAPRGGTSPAHRPLTGPKARFAEPVTIASP